MERHLTLSLTVRRPTSPGCCPATRCTRRSRPGGSSSSCIDIHTYMCVLSVK
uniref:Uncharacterized protein n=1 Tax=Arundo donax TaxID=35708 RepID=A0A0A9B1T1_ARUDO